MILFDPLQLECHCHASADKHKLFSLFHSQTQVAIRVNEPSAIGHASWWWTQELSSNRKQCLNVILNPPFQWLHTI